MAIELVDTASGADDGSGSSGCSCAPTAAAFALAAATLTDDFSLLDDWATGEQDHAMLSGEADDNASVMWHMNSIDVASCFAGDSTASTSAAAGGGASSAAASVGAVLTASDVAAAIDDSDPLFGAVLGQWWDASGVDAKVSSASSFADITSESAPVKLEAPEREVTDALLAVFAPHAAAGALSDDSQTDSGAESSSAQLHDLRLSSSRAGAASPASSVSSTSSSYVFGSASAGAHADSSAATPATDAGATSSSSTGGGGGGGGKTRPPLARRASATGGTKTAGGGTKSASSAKTADASASASAGKKPRARSAAKTEVAEDEKDLTPLEIRRKRNRESMQRARQRQRDDVEEMKETLQELEAHYQKLSDAAQERREQSAAGRASGSGGGIGGGGVSGGVGDGVGGGTNGTNGSSIDGSNSSSSSSQRLEAQYYAAADLSHSLKEEKFLLEQMLMEKQKTYRRLQQVMVDRVQELELPCPTTTTPETLFPDFEFAPITEAQADELIRQCYLSILQFQDAATPLTPPRGMRTPPRASGSSSSNSSSYSASGSASSASSSGKTKAARSSSLVTSQPFPPAATFGWKVSCHVTPDQNFFVSFAKYFPGVSAEEAMLATWTRTMDPHKDRSPHRRLQRYQVLQVINDSTYVVGMDIHHPVKKGKQMRNVCCRFRLETDEGVYVIGRASMNPKSPELRRMAEEHATFEYVDNYSWIEFSTVRDAASGEDGVWVKFNACTEYNTLEDSHLRLVNSLFLTLKWESAVIPNAKPSFFLAQ